MDLHFSPSLADRVYFSNEYKSIPNSVISFLEWRPVQIHAQWICVADLGHVFESRSTTDAECVRAGPMVPVLGHVTSGSAHTTSLRRGAASRVRDEHTRCAMLASPPMCASCSLSRIGSLDTSSAISCPVWAEPLQVHVIAHTHDVRNQYHYA